MKNSRELKVWTAEDFLEIGRSYQPAAVYAAAADLDLFATIARQARSAKEIATRLQCDLRGILILLDALTALKLLVKQDDRYSLPPGAAEFLTSTGSRSILGMAQHQANCMRRWAQLAQAVKSGRPAARTPSVRGEAGDQESFIEAMHNVSAPAASQIIRAVKPLQFSHLLDIGGASGTWTIAFLQACPAARATIFDLPEVIPLARRRTAKAKLGRRVKFVAGDFLKDTLPGTADLAWVSAIVHQNSRPQNQRLFANVFQALAPGGRIVIRDVLMHENRVAPALGALFAVNMLVATEGGGTFTFGELREDLQAAGFVAAEILHREDTMNSLIAAQKP